jgi:hypothetical protein
VELFERVGIDRLSMAFCEDEVDLLALTGCENMRNDGTTWCSNQGIDTG